MINIVAPIMQRHWKWPAVTNFFLGGSASGLFLHLFWKNVIFKNPSLGRTTLFINMIPAIMTLVGFFVLTLEAGRPSRSVYLVLHLKKSWMSREALFGFFFICLTICYALTDFATLAYGAFLAAILFMFSQSFILARARAVTSWNSNFVPLLFLTSGILSGYGLWMILHICPQGLIGNPWVTWGIIMVLINMATWYGYLWLLQNRKQHQCQKELSVRLLLMVLLDGVIPLLTLMGIYFSGMAAETAKFWFTCLGFFCGIALCLGGWLKLHYLVSKVGLMRPVTTEMSVYPPQILSKEQQQ